MIEQSWRYKIFSPQLCTIYVILLSLLALLITHPNPINSVTLSNRDGMLAPLQIKLPFSAPSNPKYKFALYKISINDGDNTPAKWHIIGDDCIRTISVNDRPVNLASATGHPCNYRSGIVIDLSPYFRKGINTVTVTVEDFGGSYAFNIRPLAPLELLTPLPRQLFYYFIAATLISCACYWLWRRKIDYLSIELFILAAIVSLHYLHISNNDAYTNDLEWHLGYIRYISQHWLNPYGYSVQQSSHPPLYYYIASVITLLNQRLLGAPYKTVLRFLSWVFFLAFNGFNLLTLRRSKFPKLVYYSCAALLLLWPGNDHLASKINSEACYYALAAASFYYTIVWWQEGRQADLIKALIISGIASLVRTNAVILFTLIGILMVWALLRGRLSTRAFFTKEWAIGGIILLLLAALSIGNIIFSGHTIGGMTSNNRPFPLTHYLSMHYSFAPPFLRGSNKIGFFEDELKTFMFGEYSWPSPELAVPMNYLLVAILFYTFLPLLFASRKYWQSALPYVVYLGVSQLFLISFSMIVKYWAAQDARYVYPALICFVVLFGQSQAYYQKRRAFLFIWLGPLLAIGFASLSTYFFWNNFR